jgi:uncharacterized protein YbjT (DUF2867 family)
MKTAVIAGATGLIGNQVLAKLLASSRYATVVALTRKPLKINHPALVNIITDFRNLDKALSGLKPDDVFCCLGTTMAKAGSKEKFYAVDFQYPVELAKATFAGGAKQYLLVSALGADRNSSIYYNRVKGEVEDAIAAIGFDTVHILRPSLLLGPRAEKRAGEDAAKLIYKIFSFAIPPKYKAISSERVATVMVDFAARDSRGSFIHESRDMRE